MTFFLYSLWKKINLNSISLLQWYSVHRWWLWRRMTVKTWNNTNWSVSFGATVCLRMGNVPWFLSPLFCLLIQCQCWYIAMSQTLRQIHSHNKQHTHIYLWWHGCMFSHSVSIYNLWLKLSFLLWIVFLRSWSSLSNFPKYTMPVWCNKLTNFGRGGIDTSVPQRRKSFGEDAFHALEPLKNDYTLHQLDLHHDKMTQQITLLLIDMHLLQLFVCLKRLI